MRSTISTDPLTAQKVLVLGGTGRMGKAIAWNVCNAGGKVVVGGRDAERAQKVAFELSDAEPLQIDPGNLAELAHALPSDLAHIVVAIGNTGSGGSIAETDTTTTQEAFGRFWAAHAVLHLAPTVLPPDGSVLLISGSSAKRPLRGYGTWTALHGAIEALARAAAVDLAPIRVNVVSPGGIGIKPDRQLAHHLGQPDDIGAAAAMILANPAMTGAIVDVDMGERLGDWSG